jgi:hypothetical protein
MAEEISQQSNQEFEEERQRSHALVVRLTTPSIVAGLLNIGLLPTGESTGMQKRLAALNAVLDSIDLDVIAALPQIAFIALDLAIKGEILKSRADEVLKSDCVKMYLSPILEFESQEYVNHVVAHEFAHIILGHHKNGMLHEYDLGVEYENQPREVAVDQFAVDLGFPKPIGRTALQDLFEWLSSRHTQSSERGDGKSGHN